MAGVQWSGGKQTRSAFAASQRHNEELERLKRQHDNEHIDKSHTSRNWSVNGLSYEQRLRKLDSLLSSIDTGRASRGRNERIVVQSVLGYVPREVELRGDDAVRDWVTGFIDCISELVGEEYVLDADVHYDEQHEYVDPDTYDIVMSRIHVHVAFVPVVTEEIRQVKERKLDENGEPERDARGKIRYKVTGHKKVQLDKPKLNAKQVASRENITRLNKSVDEMTFERFGVRYMTGKGKKRRSKTVEQLKIDSARAADEKLARLVRDRDAVADDVRRLEEQAAVARDTIRKCNEIQDELRAECERVAAERQAIRDERARLEHEMRETMRERRMYAQARDDYRKAVTPKVDEIVDAFVYELDAMSKPVPNPVYPDNPAMSVPVDGVMGDLGRIWGDVMEYFFERVNGSAMTVLDTLKKCVRDYVSPATDAIKRSDIMLEDYLDDATSSKGDDFTKYL